MSACTPKADFVKHTKDNDLSERARAIYREQRIQLWKSVMLFEAYERQALHEGTPELLRKRLGPVFPLPGPSIDDILGRIRRHNATIQEMLENAFFELGQLPTTDQLRTIVRFLNDGVSVEGQRVILEMVYQGWVANPTELFIKFSDPALDNDLEILRARYRDADDWLFTLRCEFTRIRRELEGKQLPIKVDLFSPEDWEQWVDWEAET